MMLSRTRALLAFGALTLASACHNNDAPTQPPSGEIMPDRDDESVSAGEVEPTDDDGATTEELGPAELEVAQPGRVNQPN